MQDILEYIKMNKDAFIVLVPAFSLILAIITLAISNIMSYFAEQRNAYRKSIEEDFKNLGASVFTILALIDVYLDKKSVIGENNWKKKMYLAKVNLSELRPKLRYSLQGLDLGLKALIRSIDWITHIKNYDSEAATKLVKLTDEVRKIIDDIACESYFKGRRPKKSNIQKLDIAVDELSFHYYTTMNNKRNESK